jgi:iron complex outermembrane receptor protein
MGKFVSYFLCKKAIFFLLCFLFNDAYSQDKILKQVNIKGKDKSKSDNVDIRLKSFSPGMKMLFLDSQILIQYQQQSLSQLLSQQVPVFVKSFGINSMATINFRGSSSAQSQVLWNGVPLNSATAGITDVSTLSVRNFDQISVVYGGSSSLLGSGNVGGALMLDNNFNFKDSGRKWQGQVGTELGSYGQLKFSFREQYCGPKFFLGLSFIQQSAKNDFVYRDNNDQYSRLSNARLKSNSTMLNMGYKLSQKTDLKFSAWYQFFDREIPPALFEQGSFKQQNDKALRLLLHVQSQRTEFKKWYSKTAFFKEQMDYKDVSIGMSSQNRTFQFYEEFGLKNKIGTRGELLLFVPISISWTLPTNDTNTRFQDRVAIASAYQFKGLKERLHFSLSARFEKIGTQYIFLPGSNASFSVSNFLKFRTSVQRSYRAPTLNEWYYQPGGNINLKPEKGWSADMGYELNLPIRKGLLFQNDVSLFYRNIQDWILWFGGSIWTPHNIAQVYSRGLESFNSLVWNSGNWHGKIGLNTSFVLATTSESYLPNDGSIGKQIPYAPRYNGQTNISFGFKKISFNYNHTYTGYRFFTTDESQFLSPFQTGNTYLAYSFFYKGLDYKLNVHCNNLWNTNYQVVNQRPMPLRNWSFGFGLGF